MVSEVGGRWQQAEEVPGTAVLNTGWNAGINSVSCESAGNCTAAGDYLDGSSAQQVFVVSETGGRWQQAEQIPGTAVLNTGRKAGINSLSCASADNCSAGGSYASGPTDTHAFVVGESNHRWQPAEETPGAAVLDTGQRGVVYSVSCATGATAARADNTMAVRRPSRRSSSAKPLHRTTGLTTWACGMHRAGRGEARQARPPTADHRLAATPSATGA